MNRESLSPSCARSTDRRANVGWWVRVVSDGRLEKVVGVVRDTDVVNAEVFIFDVLFCRA